MGTGIIVCGLNGSGKSTLGKQLADALQYKFIDIEDCYFPKNCKNYIYDNSRSHEEAMNILANEIKGQENFVLAAVKGAYGKEISALYKYAVFISVPKETRLQRVKERSLQRFGSRILPGGDLYKKEKRFFDMAAQRTEKEIEEWLKTINCTVIRIDGIRSIEENVRKIIKEVNGRKRRDTV